MEKRFNLLTEPWIKVLDKNLVESEKSLLDVLFNAHEIKCIAGDSPLQDISIERLLLAIIITIFYKYDENGYESLLNEADIDPEDNSEVENLVLSRFKAYFSKGYFPSETISKYLDKYLERFYLVHPETPFYQITKVIEDKKIYGTKSDISILVGTISGSNNVDNRRWFGEESYDIAEHLTDAELARWLVHHQAFSGNVKVPKGVSAGHGRLGHLGLVAVNGKNLFETLMLNLCPLDLTQAGSVKLWGRPNPIWEQPVKTHEPKQITGYDNLPALYTIQSRRIYIEYENDRPINFYIAVGDYFPTENYFAEPMTIWQEIKGKKGENPIIKPQMHKSEISIWREFPTMVGFYQGNKGEYNPVRRPGNLLWIQKLASNKIIPKGYVSVSSYGMIYDSQSYKFENIIYDCFGMSLNILTEVGSDWTILIKDEIAKCTKVEGIAFKNFIDDIHSLYNRSKDSGFSQQLRIKLQTEFYNRIDGEFRKWLISIDPDKSNIEDKRKEWEDTARRTALIIAEEFINTLPDTYRSVTDKNGYFVSAHSVYKKFKDSLYKIYPFLNTKTLDTVSPEF